MLVQDTPQKKYLNYREAANALGVSERTVRKLAASRQIRAVKIGRCIRISQNEFSRFCEALPRR